MAQFYYGGQAVIEGVLMRGRTQATVVVRRPSGSMVERTEPLPASLYERRASRLPLLRGLVALWEMLILGTRLMLFSAAVQAGVDEREDIPKRLVGVMLVISVAFAVGLFFVLPLLVTRAAASEVHSSLLGNALEGVIRLALFLGYLVLIGHLGQMKRVFQYHGAEHKTINAYEQGLELSPASVRRASTIHVRCGTAFLLWVVVISIFAFALLGHPPILVGVASRIVLVPVIAALGYEILRLGARFYGVPAVRLLLQPGLVLQRLTTREPTDDQVEVAIAALRQVLRADGVAVDRSEPVELGVV